MEAAVAECGNLSASPGFSEMMTSYVILSRLKVADGLLLLRAFSRDLFNNGTPPGPHCLLKFLRARFTKQTSCTGTAHESTLSHAAKRQRLEPTSNSADETTESGVYRLVDAKDEFTMMSKNYEDRRGKKKLYGSVWKCYHCEFDWPASSYGANNLTDEALYAHCVAPGVYRSCQVCTEDKEKWPADVPDTPRLQGMESEISTHKKKHLVVYPS